MSGSFFGKYRGIVTSNTDPEMRGRIQARVPDVLGDAESGWALPCAPFGGSGMGFLALPSVGAGVWLEFEHGDPDYPVWSGAWFGSTADVPPELLVPPGPSNKVMIVTAGGTSILLDDTPGTGGITLKVPSGAKLVIGDLGIQLDNGQGATIQLQGPQVSVNNGALQVI